MGDDYTALLRELRENSPVNHHVWIAFNAFRDNNQVVEGARALHRNEYAQNFTFYVDDESDFDDILPLNWGPLLREIETRGKLENVEVLFPSLQQNANLLSLEITRRDFSINNTEGFVSFLDGAPALTDLKFTECSVQNAGAARNIATALQRNNRIRSLSFCACGAALICSILQGLSSSASTSSLKKLVFGYNDYAELVEEPVAEALQQYLESEGATITCLKLERVVFDHQVATSHILRGLSRNTSVDELSFLRCEIDTSDEAFHQHQVAQMLANLVQRKRNLRILRFPFGNTNFFDYQVFLHAIVAELTCRECSWKCLEISTTGIPIASFRTIMAAVSKSIQLEQLIVELGVRADRVQALLKVLPSSKIKEFSLETWLHATMVERFLEAMKRNYTIQKVHLSGPFYWQNFRNGAHRARLDFYLNRNHKLAEWTKNPQTVPKELWSYAVSLALEAGVNSLFQSLVSVAESGIDLRRPRGRKRKRPQYYTPT